MYRKFDLITYYIRLEYVSKKKHMTYIFPAIANNKRMSSLESITCRISCCESTTSKSFERSHRKIHATDSHAIWCHNTGRIDSCMTLYRKLGHFTLGSHKI